MKRQVKYIPPANIQFPESGQKRRDPISLIPLARPTTSVLSGETGWWEKREERRRLATQTRRRRRRLLFLRQMGRARSVWRDGTWTGPDGTHNYSVGRLFSWNVAKWNGCSRVASSIQSRLYLSWVCIFFPIIMRSGEEQMDSTVETAYKVTGYKVNPDLR